MIITSMSIEAFNMKWNKNELNIIEIDTKSFTEIETNGVSLTDFQSKTWHNRQIDGHSKH